MATQSDICRCFVLIAGAKVATFSEYANISQSFFALFVDFVETAAGGLMADKTRTCTQSSSGCGKRWHYTYIYIYIFIIDRKPQTKAWNYRFYC